MSREFGSYSSGYFHSQMQTAADDCKAGRDPLTQLWGEFLDEFAAVAYDIASSEACDSGPDAPIIETIQRMPSLKRKLNAIEMFVEPYKRVADEAVRRKVSLAVLPEGDKNGR